MVLLRSEIPSGMCAKLRTVAASNNTDHARNLSSRTLVMFNRSHVKISRATTSRSLAIACPRCTHVFSFFAHIPFMVIHTINATPPERLQCQCHSAPRFSHIILKTWWVIQQTSRTGVRNMVINILLEHVIVTVNNIRIFKSSELHAIAMSKNK